MSFCGSLGGGGHVDDSADLGRAGGAEMVEFLEHVDIDEWAGM